MFVVMGITGKAGGATAKHLSAHIGALVRHREKAANWANQSVELLDSDWSESAAIEQALQGVEGAFVMLPASARSRARSRRSSGLQNRRGGRSRIAP